MIAAMLARPAVDAMVAALHARGHAIVPEAFAPDAIAALRGHALAQDAAGAFIPARTGRALTAGRAPHEGARGDRIAWLDAAAPAPCEAPVRAGLAALREACNRELYLGIVDDELHYALYPPGAGYARHRDRFRDDDTRVLSVVLYLNAGWQPADGGALRLHLPAGAHTDIVPQGGTLVVFLADAFEHEVLPATRERASLTGWMRRRPRAR
mgnify:CR=1 FL=1